ncbi:MAG: hypothetical protein HC897_03715 [Thermoanaerobaculia bacterium]|nr:hypothetical protein [Thermoanaerobaculia bacterium]
MNELDSQRMAGRLMQQGMLPTRDPQEADLILLNSCSVREKAAQKAYSRLGEYRLIKKERPHLLIGFCGCVAQQEGEKALRRVPDLDFVIGPGRVGEIEQIVQERRNGKRVVATGFPDARVRNYDFDDLSREGSYKGMVTIIEGCNKKCTFCIVPSTRGPEQSRPMAHVLAEVRTCSPMGLSRSSCSARPSTTGAIRKPAPISPSCSTRSPRSKACAGCASSPRTRAISAPR